jgi:hypothetical protein
MIIFNTPGHTWPKQEPQGSSGRQESIKWTTRSKVLHLASVVRKKNSWIATGLTEGSLRTHCAYESGLGHSPSSDFFCKEAFCAEKSP